MYEAGMGDLQRMDGGIIAGLEKLQANKKWRGVSASH